MLRKLQLISDISSMGSDAFMPSKHNDKYLEDLLEELHKLTVPVLEKIYIDAKYYACTSIKHSILKHHLESKNNEKK